VSESALRIIELYDARFPEMVKDQKMIFTMDFIAALSFGGNIAMGSDGNDEEKTDIQTQIN